MDELIEHAAVLACGNTAAEIHGSSNLRWTGTSGGNHAYIQVRLRLFSDDPIYRIANKQTRLRKHRVKRNMQTYEYDEGQEAGLGITRGRDQAEDFEVSQRSCLSGQLHVNRTPVDTCGKSCGGEVVPLTMYACSTGPIREEMAS